jgi:hypothetical protein
MNKTFVFVLNDSNPSIIQDRDLQESYVDYFDTHFPRWLSVLLFIIGVFGNTLSFVIFCHKNMRKNSTFIYLAFLCIVDLFVVIFGLGDLIIISYFKVILRNKSFLVCRLHAFLTYTFTHLSSFILASVSIDRAIATNFITFAKDYCKTTTAYKVIVVNVFLTVMINFHSLFFLGFEETVTKTTTSSFNSSSFIQMTCASKEGTLYYIFLDTYFQWLDLIFYAILPFFIMAICSFFIIKTIVVSNKRINKSTLSYKISLMKKEESDCVQIKKLNGSCDKNRRIISYVKSMRNDKQAKNRFNKTLHLTYTLISINTLFFLLVSPLTIVVMFVKGKEKIENFKILINIVYLLAYSNHSFNFIFYGLSSPPYREQLLIMLNLKKSKNKTKCTVN